MLKKGSVGRGGREENLKGRKRPHTSKKSLKLLWRRISGEHETWKGRKGSSAAEGLGKKKKNVGGARAAGPGPHDGKKR